MPGRPAEDAEAEEPAAGRRTVPTRGSRGSRREVAAPAGAEVPPHRVAMDPCPFAVGEEDAVADARSWRRPPVLDLGARRSLASNSAASHGAPRHHGVVLVRRRGGERRGRLKVGPPRRRRSKGGEPLASAGTVAEGRRGPPRWGEYAAAPWSSPHPPPDAVLWSSNGGACRHGLCVNPAVEEVESKKGAAGGTREERLREEGGRCRRGARRLAREEGRDFLFDRKGCR
jgi:hypothetical protein